MATTTNYSWTTPDDTALVKDGAAAIRSLGTAIDTTVFNNAGAAINKTIIDAKGDLIVGSAADTVARLAAGTNGYLLSANSGATNGLEWVAAPTSGGLTLISETVASSLSSLSFTSLGSYKQLLLIYFGILHSDNSTVFSIRFNNDSSTIYRGAGIQFRQATGESYATSKSSLQGEANGQQIYSWGDGANAPGNNDSTSVAGRILIDNYTSSTKAKHVDWKVNYYANGLGQYHALNVNHFFDSTSAITSIDIVRISGSGTFSNSGNSTIRLYGVS